MANKMLTPALKSLFAEFDRIAPNRDHASDGDIGNTAHQAEMSDHNPDETGNVPIHDADHVNEIHAIDVDDNLNESDLTMEKCVQFLLARCRSGKEKRLRYIIYNRRIWSASSGWVQKTYTGASAHTEHAHFSGSYETTHEMFVGSWHMEEIPVALTSADKTWISQQIATIKRDVLAEVLGLNDKIEGAEGHPNRTYRQYLGDASNLRGYLVGDAQDGPNAGVSPVSPLARILRAADITIAGTQP